MGTKCITTEIAEGLMDYAEDDKVVYTEDILMSIDTNAICKRVRAVLKRNGYKVVD